MVNRLVSVNDAFQLPPPVQAVLEGIFPPRPFAANASNLTSGTINPARSAASTVFRVRKVAGVWPARPTSRTDVSVEWIGPNPSPPIVTTGTGGMYEGDSRGITAV